MIPLIQCEPKQVYQFSKKKKAFITVFTCLFNVILSKNFVCLNLSVKQDEQNLAPLSTLLNVIDTERSFGNRCFNQSRYEDAKHRYKRVSSVIQGLFDKS